MPTQLRRPSTALVVLVASNVRRLRRERGLSQEQLADLCGLHRTYIGSAERGERNLTLSSLELIARALNVPVVDLLVPGQQ